MVRKEEKRTGNVGPIGNKQQCGGLTATAAKITLNVNGPNTAFKGRNCQTV